MNKPTIPPRFPVTPEQIDQQVSSFYECVRRDDLLGPIFQNHVHNWLAHEEKIASFWRNAILFKRGYDGNPQRVHIERPDITPDLFARWLDLFEEVANRNLPPETAIPWVALARRIGAGMRAGVTAARQPAGAPPILR